MNDIILHHALVDSVSLVLYDKQNLKRNCFSKSAIVLCPFLHAREGGRISECQLAVIRGGVF